MTGLKEEHVITELHVLKKELVKSDKNEYKNDRQATRRLYHPHKGDMQNEPKNVRQIDSGERLLK